MSDQPAGEKSFEPTEKRKRDATKKGDVLRSKEVATAIAVATGGASLIAISDWLYGTVRDTARTAFSFDQESLDRFSSGAFLLDVSSAIFVPVLILGLIVMACTLASQLAFGEGRVVWGNLAVKGSRMNPLSGLKRMFGPQGLIELGKSLLKIILLGGIAAFWAIANIPPMLGMGLGELEAQLAAAWSAVIWLVGLLTLGLLVIALVDWPIQLIRRNNRLKMTQQELRDETKETEGSPEKRMAQRQRQRDLARGGVAKAMNEAQFVITNPIHFAVAMTYDPTLAAAPVVLAKGRGEKALAMRELAYEKGLPVLEYPALARSVYFTTRENQVIRQELYVAIARLVAFVFSLKRGEHPDMPRVDVPIELRFDADGEPMKA